MGEEDGLSQSEKAILLSAVVRVVVGPRVIKRAVKQEKKKAMRGAGGLWISRFVRTLSKPREPST